MSNSIWELPIATIEKALTIRKQIDTLKASVDTILGGTEVGNGVVAKRRGRPTKNTSVASPTPAKPVVKTTKKRTMSPEARARIAAAQKARWAKQKAA